MLTGDIREGFILAFILVNFKYLCPSSVAGDDTMTMSKRDLQKRQKDWKQELTVLEAKCAGGSGTKEDYAELTRMRKKTK